MRLSEIKGDRVLDVIADITGPICELAGDGATNNILSELKENTKAERRAEMIRRVGENAPFLIRAHKEAIITILATLEGQSVEAYRENMTLPGIINGITEAITDDCFMDLFTSAQTQTSGK